jgi:hypothetical protein
VAIDHGSPPERPDAQQPTRRRAEPALPTAETLTRQEAEAQELHRELERVRDLLAVPLPASGPRRTRASHRDRRSRRTVALVASTCLLLTAAVLVGAGLWRGESGASTPGGDQRRAAALPTVPAETLRDLPGNGPGIDTPGAIVSATILRDRSVWVTERVVFRGPEPRSLTVTPRPVNAVTARTTGLVPGVTDLTAFVNGIRVASTRTGPRTWTVTAPQSLAQSVRLEYRLTGAVRLSQDPAGGRALALVTPLLAGQLLPGPQPVIGSVAGDRVLNVVCADAPPAQTVCTRRSGRVWSGPVPAGAASANFLVQLDVSAAPAGYADAGAAEA